MTEEQLKKLCNTGDSIRKELSGIHASDEFECLICTTIDNWCKENRKNPRKVAFEICQIIQEAKGVKK